jgi:hypothetical protein
MLPVGEINFFMEKNFINRHLFSIETLSLLEPKQPAFLKRSDCMLNFYQQIICL